MAVGSGWSARKAAAAAAMTAMMVIAPMIAASEAQALGNNREVERHCGTNRVSSGFDADKKFWAQTVKASGTCAGRLSAALELTSGYWTKRVYGTSKTVYASTKDKAKSGLHWGCDDCNVTRS